ncbi:DinB/UmuC family translesion DNA polymerase, partial [Tenacibaculum discolor]|uniref:DinB/UmuC family translesion DNA polymerase n=1 Tax=Tenacibaculum discolor TaxID=361581 RepID=UPI003F6659A3
TRSFENTYADLENITERISTFASSCAKKLRDQKSNCHVITVFLRSNRFDKNQVYLKENKTVFLSYPSDSTLTISSAAIAAVKTIFKKDVNYKKAGVIISGLVPNDN